MSKVLQITDGTTTVSLTGGSLILKDGGWSYKTSAEKVWETLDVFGRDTDANLRSALANLDRLFEAARRFAENPLNATPVTLQWQSEGEAAKQALVYDGSYEVKGNQFQGPQLGRNRIEIRLAVLRAAEFETTTGTALTQAGISTTGGTWLIGNAVGTALGRIALLTATTDNAATTQGQLWFGIRPLYSGTAGFVPVWEFEASAADFTDTAAAADATASGGSKRTCTFATHADLHERASIALDDVSDANYDDMIGRYLVLLRCKLDAATTEVHLVAKAGWAGISALSSQFGETYISGQTGWALVELGQVSLPPTGNRDALAASLVSSFLFEIWAERLSEAGSLDLDCLILIPCEHLLTVKSAVVAINGTLSAYTDTSGAQYALNVIPSGLAGNVEAGFTDWAYPVGGGLLVAAAQYSTHALGKTLDVGLTLVPRWRGYRTA